MIPSILVTSTLVTMSRLRFYGSALCALGIILAVTVAALYAGVAYLHASLLH